MSPVPFVELRAKTAFSWGDGTATPEALVERAAELGYEALGICDAADVGGLVRAGVAAERAGLRLVAGAELVVDGRPLALLVRNEAGYRNLAQLITHARLERERGRPGVAWAAVARRSEGLHLLTGSPSGALAARVRAGRTEEALDLLARYRAVCGAHVAVEVQRHWVSGEEAALAEALIDLAGRAGVPWVVTQEPRYLDGAGRRVHDLLTALRLGTTYDEALRQGKLLPNGEWRLRSPAEMARLWAGSEAGLETSARIADECTFRLRWMRPPLPRFELPPGHTDDSFLRTQVIAGARERWGEIGERERAQIEHELGVIGRLGFAGFFLIMADAVAWARARNILCQGRGSAANSVVAYALGITAVDPVRHDLLFERFLSDSRVDGMTEAPDIDVDFESGRREEVLDYVYGRYGRGHAAITAVTQVFSAPTALQDLARALGYAAEAVRPLSKRLHRLEPSDGAVALEEGLAAEHGLDLQDARGRTLLAAMRALDDVPRLRSTHPGGFVLSAEPLGAHVPIERTTRGRTILQLDKDDLDSLGIPKFDFLGLGALSALRVTFDEVERRTGRRLELYSLPPDDRRTFEAIAWGDTIGAFQIESRAQIQSLVQTKPERMYDIVVQVALIRPGPIVAKFVHPYTRRRRGQEKVTYPHPALEPILARTQGICIFQEQAMAVSIALGGYTPAEADQLRRAMGHQRKAARLQAELERLEARMRERGVEAEVAERIVEDMAIFANYGFPESHAWSFGLLAYATMYVRVHHPAETLVGLLRAQPMGFYAPATLVHDARRHRLEVRPPCLERGAWESTVEETDDPARPAVRIGWRHIRGLGTKAGEALRAAAARGPFRGVEDVVRRAGLGRAEALALAQAGAFSAWTSGRYTAAWEALRAAGDRLPLAPARSLPYQPEELSERDRVYLDYLAVGVCVDGHPMAHLRRRLARAGVRVSTALHGVRDRAMVRTAGLVVARQHPSTSKGTVFLLLEDEKGFVNVIVPKELYAEHRETVKHSPILLIEGKLEKNGPVLNVVGKRFRRLETPALAFRSHDFR